MNEARRISSEFSSSFFPHVEDERGEAKKHMPDSCPDLRAMYNEDDGNIEVDHKKRGGSESDRSRQLGTYGFRAFETEVHKIRKTFLELTDGEEGGRILGDVGSDQSMDSSKFFLCPA